MKFLPFCLIILYLFSCNNFKKPTQSQRVSLLLSADIQNLPPRITLKWNSFEAANSYTIYRKMKYEEAWTFMGVKEVIGDTLRWNDNQVAINLGYEYKVVMNDEPYASGYLYAGINLEEVSYRGKILFVYDVTLHNLDEEIEKWINDVTGDGWEVIKIPVTQDESVKSVKNKILIEFNKDPQNVKAAFLFGKVPVPYSGNVRPDGHWNHHGAWPADVYYGDLTGIWTDSIVNNTSASDPRNHNVPGDGKFDQNTFPNPLKLQIGRVDMSNLPAFPMSEEELLRNYLYKNHSYRNKLIEFSNCSLIDDNFKKFDYASSAWRSFGVLCGSNIDTTDFFTSAERKNYQWIYASGRGWFSDCKGVGSTHDFATKQVNSIFSMLFGSYFGDWDNENNLLRAAIANGNSLANCWAGKPQWYFHHMGMGETIGFSAALSMNNLTTYENSNYSRKVYMALMGDPTLRAHIVAPVSNFVVEIENKKILLKWVPSKDIVLGYNVYRKNEKDSKFEKINRTLIPGNFFRDSIVLSNSCYTYMIRAVRLEKTNSGSFFNMSTGVQSSLFYKF